VRGAFLPRLLSENRNKLMEVEAELSVLRRDIKLTSAPKKQAMELMRRKIEVRTKPAQYWTPARALTGRVSTTGG
jgi:hypothetical protein